MLTFMPAPGTLGRLGYPRQLTGLPVSRLPTGVMAITIDMHAAIRVLEVAGAAAKLAAAIVATIGRADAEIAT